jgi:hypothetical protein
MDVMAVIGNPKIGSRTRRAADTMQGSPAV